MSNDSPLGENAARQAGAREEPLAVSIAGRSVSIKALLGGLSLVVLLFAPAVLPGFLTQILTLSLVLAVFAISVDLLWGYTGILTFGHAVFLGFGAYLMGKLLQTLGPSPGIVYVGFILSALLPGLLGLVLAGMLFYRGIGEDYFTIITLAFAIIAEQIAVSWSSVTNGANGLLVPVAQIGIPAVFSIELTGWVFYYGCVLVLLLIYVLGQRIVQSPFGRALVAINENEMKANALGYNTDKYKTLVFGLSSAMAGFAGTLYVLSEQFVSPPLLGFVQSTDVLIWVLVGGRGTLIGPIIGTIFLRLFENTISGALAFSWVLILGIVLILIVLLFPRGIVGLLDIARDRLKERLNQNADQNTEP